MFLPFIQISWNNWQEMTWEILFINNDLDFIITFY